MWSYSNKINSLRAGRNACSCILAGFSFLVLTLLTVKAFVPEVKVDAASQTASQTVGPYTMSMANDSVATINITPTSSQAVYTGTNNLSVTNTCSAGATITMTTNSTTSNSLTRSATNSDTLTKDIAATTTTGLDNNSWGYALNNSSTYYAVPKKGQTAATIYNTTAAQTSALTVPVKFGVKTDNELSSGTYTNDVIYTMTPKSGCNSYSVTWNYDGGTAKSGATYPTSLSWGQTVNLSTLTPTKSGYTFAGWTNGSSNYTGSETAANLNSSNSASVTVTAKWTSNCNDGLSSVGSYKNFDYTGSAQTFNACAGRTYKLEVWGAQGGTSIAHTSATGGLGGYSVGEISLPSDMALYFYVGGQGKSYYTSSNSSGASCSSSTCMDGGYNGGGKAKGWSSGHAPGSGGGGTDVRINSTSLYARVIVAGGGGGGGDNNNYTGGYGGGLSGRNATNSSGTEISNSAGTQTSGYAFGQGGHPTNDSGEAGGGGGGWYGGYGSSGTSENGAGGGGSGYVYTSSTAGNYPSGKLIDSSYYLTNAQTIAGNASMPNPRGSGNITGNTGNGYARITRQS